MAKASQLRKLHPKGQGFLDGVLDDEEVRAIEVARDEGEFEIVDGDQPGEHRCPACGYEWFGNPKPTTADDAAAEEP